jgi:hypothetical protein
MSNQISVGAIYFDWGVTANVKVLEWNGLSSKCRAKVVDSGVAYTARVDHLEPKR